MERVKRNLLIASVILVLVIPAVIFIYPSITGSYTMINADFLEDDGWVLHESKAVEFGEVAYYNRSTDEQLIIRMRTFDKKSDAMNRFAANKNLNATKDPEYINYKDLSFFSVYYQKFRGKGPWLTLSILDDNTMTELIYTNQERGQEYSGNYDNDTAWLLETAKELLGE